MGHGHSHYTGEGQRLADLNLVIQGRTVDFTHSRISLRTTRLCCADMVYTWVVTTIFCNT